MRKNFILLSLLTLIFIAGISFTAFPAQKKTDKKTEPTVVGPPSADMNNPHINTFAVTIVDSKNQKTLMYNVSCGKGVEKYLEFHGLRGAGDVIIPFSKVKSVEIMGKVPATSDLYSSNPHVNTVFHLIDGHSIIVAIPGKWKWRGETAFGELSINTEDLKVITFHHEGSAMRCSQCGKIFHIEGFQYCPYDGKKMDEISE